MIAHGSPRVPLSAFLNLESLFGIIKALELSDDLCEQNKRNVGCDCAPSDWDE